jgi:hypothetical protein
MASKPLCCQSASSSARSARACCACRAETAKISGARPSSAVAFSARRSHLERARQGEDVDLVDDQHDLLAPRPDLLEELPLALGERAVGGGDEEDQVGARHEVAGQLLVAPHHRVGAGRVDDVQLAQQLRRVRPLEQVRLARCSTPPAPSAAG